MTNYAPEDQLDTDRGAGLDRALAGFSGLLAAGFSLAVSELIAGMSSAVPSLVVTVGDSVIDSKFVPTGIRRWSIDTLGTNQKPALVAGVVVISLLVGVIVGIASRKRPWIGALAFGAFGLIGGLAAGSDPLTGSGWGWFNAILSAALGFGALMLMLRSLDHRVPAHTDSNVGALLSERRWFLGAAGATALGALFASGLGRRLSQSRNLDSERDEVATRLFQADETAAAAPPPTTATTDIATFDSVDGISPLITPNDEFYRIDTALQIPLVDPEDWTLKITGMVANPLEISFAELLDMDLVEESVTLSCVSNDVGGRLVGNAVWLGVPLTSLLDTAGVQDGATQIVGRSVDDWTAGFPTEAAYDGRTALIAVAMNGEPLPTRHGFPARLVVAGLYGYVSATKWLSEIHLTTWADFDAYWIPRGWSKEGPIKTQSRIDVPRSGSDVAAGTNAIAGVAWAPSRSISKVEVQVDDGVWTETELVDELSENSWRQWKLEWDAPPGDHRIRVRATDGDGETQTSDESDPAPDGATGWHTVDVSVSA
jgi:DMSO/TMAO reductase YedYZ molybdopterin-dependent catalytic subunit